MNANAARMDTDSDSESEDQYELDKLEATMEARKPGVALLPETETRRVGELSEIENLLKMEDKKDPEDDVF